MTSSLPEGAVRRRSTHKGRRGGIDEFDRLRDGSASAQQICERVAIGFEANAIVVERSPDGFLVVAGAPWHPVLEALDRLALDACFRTSDFTGHGSRFSAGSDWLFLPIVVGRETVAAVGLAGRFSRRRFEPEVDPLVSAVRAAVEATYGTKSQEV